MRIIITIPALNEEKTIGKVIEDIKLNIDNNYDFDILVIDDGSKDKTIQVVKKHGAIVISNKINLGLAETFKIEMKECLKYKPDIIVHSDADGQYPAHYINDMIRKIEQGYDLVLGSRFGKGNYSNSFMKKMGNIAFAKVFSQLLKIKLTDTTTGFRAFTPEVAKLPLINNFTYTQEQLIRAGKARMKITEIPINANKTRESKLFKSPFDYAFKAWINILRIYRDFAPLKFFGIIGISLFTIGLIMGLYFIYLHFTSGIFGHFGLLFLMLILLFSGLQITLFGFLADMMLK